MTIQDWGAIGELVGGVAVIVTLIYIALQIRQNTRTIRLSTGYSNTKEFRDMFAALAENSGLSELIHKAANDATSISGAEKMRFYSFNNNFTRACENAYIQSTQGVLDPKHWAGMKRMMIDFTHMPGFREYWLNRKHWHSEDFQHFMDAEILQSDAKAGVPLPGAY